MSSDELLVNPMAIPGEPLLQVELYVKLGVLSVIVKVGGVTSKVVMVARGFAGVVLFPAVSRALTQTLYVVRSEIPIKPSRTVLTVPLVAITAPL